MARPIKSGLDYFPVWQPKYKSRDNMNSSDMNVRYHAVRNASSSFIKRQDVRDIIFSRDDYRCTKCSSKNDLQVDHIVSVYRYVNDKLDFENLNKQDNLETLCKRCNAAKLP